jgi:2-oxoglutarate ferredoxin oxidoreductase subunit gamma
VQPGGVILVNSSIIDKKVSRGDVKVAYVPANDIAAELGNAKVLNMVMLGAYIAKTGVVKADTLVDYVKEVFGSKKPELVELNKKAIEKGAASAQ